MQKEAVYLQRIKDLQEEVHQKDETIKSLLEKIKDLEENKEVIIDKQNYIESVKDVVSLVEKARSELREIQIFKDELAQKVRKVFRS